MASLGSHASQNVHDSSTAAGASGGHEASPASQAVAYTACMRAHGVPNFPEPQVTEHGGEVQHHDRRSPASSGNPQFKSAQQACRKLLPGGGPGEKATADTPANRSST